MRRGDGSGGFARGGDEARWSWRRGRRRDGLPGGLGDARRGGSARGRSGRRCGGIVVRFEGKSVALHFGQSSMHGLEQPLALVVGRDGGFGLGIEAEGVDGAAFGDVLGETPIGC